MAKTLLSNFLAVFWRVLFLFLAMYSIIVAICAVTVVLFSWTTYAELSKFPQIFAVLTLGCEVLVASFMVIFASCARVLRRFQSRKNFWQRFVENLKVLRNEQEERGKVENTSTIKLHAMRLLLVMLIPEAVINRQQGSPVIAGSVAQIIALVDNYPAIIKLLETSVLLASIFFLAFMARVVQGSDDRPEPAIFLDISVVLGRMVTGSESDEDEPRKTRGLGDDLEAKPA
ncbi:hypothetical protein C8J56DRAFT_385327 [Mycena floridula]|nr:hypothetical protein C8J56DRAFT_385327 [Mycena floridula]